MDLFYLTGSDSARSKIFQENFSELNNEENETVQITLVDVIRTIFSLVIMIYAGIISWNCSGMYSTPLRVLFSLLAALFGTTYIILFFIFRSDICKIK